MTYVNDSLIELWHCTDCGWTGSDEQLRETYNDEAAQTELVCPECDCSPYPHTEHAKLLRERGEA